MLPVLDPWSQEPLFTFADGRLGRVRVVKRAPLSFKRIAAAPALLDEDVRVCDLRQFRSGKLGLIGVFCVDEDQGVLLDALRAAEGAILFFAWLRRTHGR